MSQGTIFMECGPDRAGPRTPPASAIKTQGWLDGHYAGLEQGAGWLREKAVALFKAKKYTEAEAMQKLADDMMKDLEPAMRGRAEEHRENHPDVIGKE